jgi:hypothetical protein
VAREVLDSYLPMQLSILKSGLLAVVALLLLTPVGTRASIVWTYDFPGSPGSGLAADQTNPQPAGATFSDWNRVNLSAGTTADVLDSNFWNNTAVFDSTQYESFSITATAGCNLDLQLLSFDEMRTAGGPTKGHVEMFINGSSAPWAVYNYNPSASWKTETFNFTPTTDADNVTSVEFRFYGWNGGTPSASLLLDNVSVVLTIGGVAVPEASSLGPIALLLCCVLGWKKVNAALVGVIRR